MQDNHKFIALLMGQEDLNFEEIFNSLPSEEQESFLDFMIKLSLAANAMLLEAPLELKLQIIPAMAASITKEALGELSQAMLILGDAFNDEPS